MVATLTAPVVESDTPAARGNASARDVSTIVVVGNGPVGFQLLEKLCARNVHEHRRLIAFGEEPRPAYDRVRLTSCFNGGTPDSLQFANRHWYEERGITLRTGDPVVSINTEDQTVRSRSLPALKYDTLVLATGSHPFVPPIEGRELPGVFAYRTVDDVGLIRDYSRKARTAAVIGGGLLGLEAARALLDLGLETHVVEMASVLMPRQLDNEGAALLRDMIERLGVHVHLQKETRRIHSVGDRRVLEFTDGSLAVDMIVIAAGIRPRDELAREAGIETGSRGGIVVDDCLRTSDPHVFAIGECALHRGSLYGLAAPGYQMADVVADRIDGGSAAFTGSDVSTRLKLLGVDVSLCGDYLDVSDARTLSVHTGDAYRKLVLRNRRLVGAVGVGPFPELPRVQEGIARRRRIRRRQRRRFESEGSLWSSPGNQDVNAWPAGAIVCSCVGVSRGELSAAWAAGCSTPDALAVETRASTVCGSCRPQLVAIAGAPPEPCVETPGWRLLLTASVSAAVLLVLILTIGPRTWSTTVQSGWYQFETLWRDSFWKQVTGFTLLGLSTVAMTLSLRKRWPRLEYLNFGWWRAAHGVLGTLTLAGLFAHTGLCLGSNLNFWLMVTFLGLNFAGVLTGAVTAVESRASTELQRHLRAWRPRLTLLHIVCFWPLPVLLAFHIFAAYYL